MRADARRNRDAILAAAREVFDRDGILASIDGIATRAGVGNATLYRNFPTRDDLLAAVMDDSVRAIIEESADLDALEAGAALREWMFRLTWQLRIWQNLPTCIADAIDDPDSPVRTVCTRLTLRTAELLRRARDAGAATDVEADALFELLTAVSWGVDRFGDDERRARERVELATAGVLPAA
ncbi:helix-turn-helix domain-containing protein [Curtobacterium sp. A7_M15]|uniref:TetR/AcrR family transcriptional regulator n=1 Tax=Curtobacterium sp. A7_M15 TaxID=3065241 RepID=UPI002737FA36|nr:TetR/AcrR family transcriptional regulator [Curtobacterium sp. A7_M15]MDP4333607.1 helix-turn-helix domain-containing protein [Curtobacterium sp. A7_M15]